MSEEALGETATESPFNRLTLDAASLASPVAAQLFQGLGVLHVRDAVPRDTLVAIKQEILDSLTWLEGEVGERVPYITVMRSEYDPAMQEAYGRLVMLLNDVLSPQFPYRDAIPGIVGATEIQFIMAYAREARNDGNPSAHVDFHQDYPTFCRASKVVEEFNPKRTITCWLPLDDIDDETPSIEYIPAWLNQELPTNERGTLDMELIGNSLDRLPHWVPPVHLGDFMLHDQFTLHRSYITPTRLKTRRSFELRFVVT